jgi:hypothetical protein
MQIGLPPQLSVSKLATFLKSKWSIVLVALALRLAVVGFLYPDQMDPSRNHWHFAFENGKVAYSIVQGHGLSSPLFEDTGLSAWQTPIYPYLIAGVFKVLGTYSVTSALCLLSLQALFSALTCLPVFLVGRQISGDRVALFSGWAWALFPLGIYWPAERIWPTWLATLLITILFYLTLLYERPSISSTKISIWKWTGYGFLWGFTALTEPVVLTVLPIMLGWIGIRRLQRRQRWFVPLTVASLAFLLFVSPWFIRNYETFHRFIPFRDSMGLEMWLGNNGDTSYWLSASEGSALTHKIGPWHNDAEWQHFKQVGELAYMDECKQKADEFIHTHHRWYAIVTVRRFVFIWTHFWSFSPYYLRQEPDDPINVAFSTLFTLLTVVGLARLLGNNKPVGILYGSVLFFFPVVFYFSHVEVYFRRQIDPIMVVLAVYGVMGFRRRRKMGTGDSVAENLEAVGTI